MLSSRAKEILIPDVDLTNQAVHSISFDPDGRLWFGENTFYGKGIVNKIGFVDAAWTCVTKLEREDFTPNYNPSGDDTHSGNAVNQDTGELWQLSTQPPAARRFAPFDKARDCQNVTPAQTP